MTESLLTILQSQVCSLQVTMNSKQKDKLHKVEQTIKNHQTHWTTPKN